MAGYARASGGTAVATRSQQGPAAFPTGSFVLSRRDPNRHFAGIVPFASDPCPTNLPTHLSERHDPGLESRPPRPDERSNHENASFDRGGPPRVPPKSTTLRPASAPLIPPSSKTLGAPRMPKGISKEEQLQAILDIIPVSPGREWTGDSRSREAQNMGGMQGRSDGRRDAEDTAFLRSREEHRSSAGPAATSARLSKSLL
ncbi:hypothetical protein M427DRAFT_282724 [Gonapodya prolifera JEL478]|uniref:Uncharacterized protein n=1 Tax=Gonapodya prolifera (strain JEL478) TaxID=1344416 RepID=A0A139AZ21_GONPJ|nr:hypothetical protein M427DRAFT_282724 [Gonapodya prolifera JEL478]|eukprot:KXS21976.1 hypothetical protein M427DRAFT_282724 [Gonapodya prolifera JEL478]